jgi:glucose-6-phosphate isomerase
MYDYVGGRFSSTSMVGGVALAFGLGYDEFMELLRGAREMDLNALIPEARHNLPLLAALLGIWNRNFLGCETVAILPYSQMLSRFVAHLQQVDMESNGKRVNRRGDPVDYATGPIVWGEPGTNGQHAFYQLIHQSQTVIPCEFLAFRNSQAGEDEVVKGTTSQQKLLSNVLAQSEALATGKHDPNPNKQFPGNRPNSLLVIDQLTPHTLGRLLAYYENRIALQGFIWNINSFDQEGVQLGKLLAEKYLEHFQGETDDPTAMAMMASAGLQ